MPGSSSTAISYLPEDLVTEILLRLPTGSTIGRFRCVCKSWRDFLSDPDSIRKILLFRNLPCVDEESLRILVTGFGENFAATNDIDRIPYSLHSYETLCPEKTDSHELPLGRTPIWNGFMLSGCCDGIFCITTWYMCKDVSHVLLWNPTTSEIKFLPLCPVPPRSGLLAVGVDIVGFGFDRQNDDYRVVQRVEFVHDDELDEDDEEDDEVTLPLVYSGVYSLKNDSWKILTMDTDDNVFSQWGDRSSAIVHVHQQLDAPRNEKCYWFHGQIPGVCGILSFDISNEVFEYVVFDVDRGFANRKSGEDSGESTMMSCTGLGFMSKGTIMAAFCDTDGGNLHEIWGLLKFGVAESWTRLLTVRTPEPMIYVEVWKGGTYIYSTDRNLGGEEGRQGDGVLVFDPAAEETVGHLRLEIQAALPRFEAYVFRPTRVPLSKHISTDSLSSD